MLVADPAGASVAMIVQWPNAAAAPRDDILSRGTRRWASTRSSSPHAAPARIALQDGRLLHGADRGHRADRQQRARPVEVAARVAGKRLRVEPPILYSLSCTASFSGARGRARVWFSRAVGRECTTGHLRCEFEVGLSLKNACPGPHKKAVEKVKQLPVSICALRLFETVQVLLQTDRQFFQDRLSPLHPPRCSLTPLRSRSWQRGSWLKCHAHIPDTPTVRADIV